MTLGRHRSLAGLAADVRLSALGVVVLMLAGCASDRAPAADRRVDGDADHVRVMGGRLDGLPLAVIHCARYGRSARFNRTDGDRAVFDCVSQGK